MRVFLPKLNILKNLSSSLAKSYFNALARDMVFLGSRPLQTEI